MTDQQDQQLALVKDTLEKGAAVARAGFDYQQTLASYWTARADFEKAVGGM